MFDDYLDTLREPERLALQAVIDHVAQVAPGATEGRSYGLPAFRHRDKPLLGFAVTRKHLSLYPFSASVLEAVRHHLSDFELSKGTVRFTVEHPIPPGVVTALVQARIAEIEA